MTGIKSDAGAKRFLVGRTIVAVALQPFDTGRCTKGDVSFDPVFTLDDGSRVWFRVDETEGDGYGITIFRGPRARLP